MFKPKENVKLFPVVMTFIWHAFPVYFMTVQMLPFHLHWGCRWGMCKDCYESIKTGLLQLLLQVAFVSQLCVFSCKKFELITIGVKAGWQWWQMCSRFSSDRTSTSSPKKVWRRRVRIGHQLESRLQRWSPSSPWLLFPFVTGGGWVTDGACRHKIFQHINKHEYTNPICSVNTPSHAGLV